MSATLSTGDRAPDFELPATMVETVSLYRELAKGPVLLLFYPLDWSPVCTGELCSIRDGLSEFSGLGVSVFGISVDSIFSHNAFAEKHALSFPLLSDFNREVCTAYGVVHEEILGLKRIAKRSAFVIDKEGIVQYAWVSDDPGSLPDTAEIKAQLEKL